MEKKLDRSISKEESEKMLKIQKQMFMDINILQNSLDTYKRYILTL